MGLIGEIIAERNTKAVNDLFDAAAEHWWYADVTVLATEVLHELDLLREKVLNVVGDY